eukprot:3797927-Amphidinium_carterae.1
MNKLWGIGARSEGLRPVRGNFGISSGLNDSLGHAHLWSQALSLRCADPVFIAAVDGTSRTRLISIHE